MNKVKMNLGKMEGTPMHLLGSMIMATYVMGYLNIVVGAAGGIPSWIAMMITFYFAWGNVHYSKLPTKDAIPDLNLAMRVLYVRYLMEYLLIWIAMKATLVFSNLWGWGSNTGLSLSEYLHAIYGETLVEQWAYFFAIIFMMAFVMAIYPFIFIRGKKWQIWYLVAVSLFFWILTKIVIAICYIWISPALRTHASSMSEILAICVTPHKWQAGLYLFAAMLVGLSIGIFSYAFARKLVNGKGKKLLEFESWQQVILSMALLSTVVLGIAFAYDMVRNQRDRISLGFETEESEVEEITTEQVEEEYEQVAEFLTNDHEFGPMLYNDCFYIPVDATLNYDETGEALGYIAYKEQNVDSAFYKLTGANVLYTLAADNNQFLEMYGADYSAFRPAEDLEREKAWTEDSLFVLWDEDWLSETAYSKDRTGYCICEKGWIETLEEKFGQVDYSAIDFCDYDAYFTIRGYQDAGEAFGEDVLCGDWVGLILVKDNTFYYGSYQNEIKGIALQELLDTLGGNHNSTLEEYEGVE